LFKQFYKINKIVIVAKVGLKSIYLFLLLFNKYFSSDRFYRITSMVGVLLSGVGSNWFTITVKFGYSDHGYNEQNELLGLVQHVLSEELHGNNELIFGNFVINFLVFVTLVTDNH